MVTETWNSSSRTVIKHATALPDERNSLTKSWTANIPGFGGGVGGEFSNHAATGVS
jgi:hypothetical protein